MDMYVIRKSLENMLTQAVGQIGSMEVKAIRFPILHSERIQSPIF